MSTQGRSKKRAKSSQRKATKFSTWPNPRQVLHRPDRYEYVRKSVSKNECVFCAARDQGVGFESLLLATTDHSMVVMNKYPYNTGHVLVLPRNHGGDLTLLSETAYTDLMASLRRTVEGVQKAYRCTGLNVGLNHGAVAGAGLPDHLHWHVIPRWHGDTNFFPLIADTKVLPETLEQAYHRLKPFFGWGQG